MATAPNQKDWINVPADSTISISGQGDGDNFTITVEENGNVVCTDAGVIPGPCERTLKGDSDYGYRIVLTIGGEPGPNVTVRAVITGPDGKPVGSAFQATAPGSANSPYMIEFNVVTI